MFANWRIRNPHLSHEISMARLSYARMTPRGRFWAWTKIVVLGPFFAVWLAMVWVWDWGTGGILTPWDTLKGWLQWSAIYCLALYPIIDRPLWPGLALATATIVVIHVRAWFAAKREDAERKIAVSEAPRRTGTEETRP